MVSQNQVVNPANATQDGDQLASPIQVVRNALNNVVQPEHLVSITPSAIVSVNLLILVIFAINR